MKVDTPAPASLLEFAVEAAWQAGRITLGYFQTSLDVERKTDDSPVTIADRQAELKLRSLIGQAWPEHGIVGEEFGSTAGGAPLTWILDPIDGTKSFVQGVPIYATLVALVDEQGPLVGVIHLPALGETVYAGRGLGCHWNGRRATVSPVGELSQAVLLSTDYAPHSFQTPAKAAAWGRLVEGTRIQRTWGDAYGYALVATGRAEIMVDPAMHVWDCAPLQVVLEEAGGTFTDWGGVATIYGNDAIATNGALFPAVMGLVNGHSQ
jgi:histidinol-phosphatase